MGLAPEDQSAVVSLLLLLLSLFILSVLAAEDLWQIPSDFTSLARPIVHLLGQFGSMGLSDSVFTHLKILRRVLLHPTSSAILVATARLVSDSCMRYPGGSQSRLREILL